jgi:dienelactone hydrolase
MSDAKSFDAFIQAKGQTLRAKDAAPGNMEEWQTRRAKLGAAITIAMGPGPARPCRLTPNVVGVLNRKGYRIEKVVFRSRPGVWISSSLYIPEPDKGKRPAVLVVHGHWKGARRDPVVQARCLGLVKLGFVVLAVDAFSAGERHPASAGYHGELLGASLWPAGLTLLGLQVYDNRRAVDYLISRPEVDPARLGVTGASGGGNQSMYAGAMDDRLKAVVPVCSVGNYQAYLKAACCVCEVLPGALRFTEEGDVLGLVAPRALLVISATKDAIQFSVEEAKKSLTRAQAIYKLHDVESRVHHAVFDSPHDYNKAMREAMYGWMTRWLKEEGDGKPIAEPAHEIEKVEDLACWPKGKRPAVFLFPPTLAALRARRMLNPFANSLDKASWEAQTKAMRNTLQNEVFGGIRFAAPDRPGRVQPQRGDNRSVMVTLPAEDSLNIRANLHLSIANLSKTRPGCVLLHLGGRAKGTKHPLITALTNIGRDVCCPTLRATGESQPPNDAVGKAPDHNSAEHAVWIGQPLLGQWVLDAFMFLNFMAKKSPGKNRLAVVGIGPAGLVALCAGALLPDLVESVAVIASPVSLIPGGNYPKGMPMGLLAPGLFRVGDVPHIAALAAPKRLLIAGGIGPNGQSLDEKELREAYSFTRSIYKLNGAKGELTIGAEPGALDLVRYL